MKIGIITWCKNEKRLFKRIKITEIDKGIFCFEIPRYQKDKKIEKAIKKAVKSLGKGEIIFTRHMKKWDKNENLFFKIAPKCADAVINRFEIDAPYDLAVKEKDMGDNALQVIRKLIFKGKAISLITENQREAEKICDALMEEFGAVGEIFPYTYRTKRGLTIDLDNESIEIFGKAVAHSFEAEGDNYGLDIDLLRLFKAQGRDFNEIVIKSFYIGKNKLTL